LTASIVKRIVQAGNSIGGAISDDGELVAVSNYEPGGVRVFDADSLELVADIPAVYGDTASGDGALSKVIGLVDVPGRRFVFTLWDAGETWIADFSGGDEPLLTKIRDVGANPYDALVTANGRHYIAGLFGEDGLSHIDLWQAEPRAERILAGYGRGEAKLPVYKMPHLEGWAEADGALFLPAIGRHELLVVDPKTFQEIGRIAVHGQPVFAMARPDGRQIWVNFALPHNDMLQVIDVPSRQIVRTLKPGPAVLHMEFAPRGHEVWLSVRDDDRLAVYDTLTFERVAELDAQKPSGIFFTARAHRTGL
ncbi:MAG TPA: cytochrome D1 domain-containing protein, partial [Afifellaceae bacterium]|nr:cytochrome D1 domain-containing protein [Afifellaceae bacterium]